MGRLNGRNKEGVSLSKAVKLRGGEGEGLLAEIHYGTNSGVIESLHSYNSREEKELGWGKEEVGQRTLRRKLS